MSATARFVTTYELLQCLAKQVRSRKQLARLSQASRALNDAVAPILFPDVTLRLKHLSSIRHLSESKKLKHVRRLCVRGERITTSMAGMTFNEHAMEILDGIPQLESFMSGWTDIPLATSTLDMLGGSCPRLRSIHIAFPLWTELDSDDLQARQIISQLDLQAFKVLEELTLDSIYYDLPELRSQIVQVLARSPGLRTLSLSLTGNLNSQDVDYHDRNVIHDWFELLCKEYEATGAAPLRLQTLRLGAAVFPPRAKGTLEKLTELAGLEELYFGNRIIADTGNIPIGFLYSDEENSRVFTPFNLADCPTLRRLIVYNYCGEAHDLISSAQPAQARQLAVFCDDQFDEYKMADLLRPNCRHAALPLHMRMIDVRLDRNDFVPIDEDDAWMADVVSAEEVLADLVAHSNALEGLRITLPENSADDYGFDFLEPLEHALAQMSKLTQLAIVSGDRAKLSGDPHGRAAVRLAAASPSLCYLNINLRYWKISRQEGSIRLESLEDREISDVELFWYADGDSKGAKHPRQIFRLT